MSAYLLVIRDRNGKPVDMGIYSGEALTIGIHDRAERAPRDYACVEGDYSEARTMIFAHILTDPEPWPEDLRPFVDHMLAEFKPRHPYREPAPEPDDHRDHGLRSCVPETDRERSLLRELIDLRERLASDWGIRGLASLTSAGLAARVKIAAREKAK